MTVAAHRCVLTFAVLLITSCNGVTSGPTVAGPGAATGGSTITPPTPVAVNTATVTVDAGPAALASGPDGYSAFNQPYVTVTVCAPGSTSNCQTIDHVLLDTGSVGLRLLAAGAQPGPARGTCPARRAPRAIRSANAISM